MSKTKDFYHDIITESQRQAMEDDALDTSYEKFLEAKEDSRIEAMAEREEVIRIYEKTGAYPI